MIVYVLSLFPRFIFFSAFHPFSRVLSLFLRFIPFSAFCPLFRVLSFFPRFIPFSAFYPFFRVLSFFPRFIPFSAFYLFFRFRNSVFPDPCFIPTLATERNPDEFPMDFATAVCKPAQNPGDLNAAAQSIDEWDEPGAASLVISLTGPDTFFF